MHPNDLWGTPPLARPRDPRLDALPLFVRTLRSRSSPGIFDRRPPSRHAAPNRASHSRPDVRRASSGR